MGEIPPTDSGWRINLSVNREVALDVNTAYTEPSNFINLPKSGGFRPTRNIDLIYSSMIGARLIKNKVKRLVLVASQFIDALLYLLFSSDLPFIDE